MSPSAPTTAFFRPDFRVLKLDRTLAAGPEAGAVIPGIVGDLVQAEVTRVNTGACQYSVTLNNWDTVLPDQQHPPRDWPRYRYNDFSALGFGDRLRIDMRYWPDPQSGGDPVTRAAQAWVPMVAGPITDMRFSFGSGGAQVVISGEDDLSRLKDKTEGKAEFSKVGEKGMVEQALARAGYPLALAAPLVEWPAFTGSAGPAESIQGGQSYLEFLQKLADKLDFEVFVEFASLTIPNDGPVAQEFHFEPARSGAGPDKQPDRTFVLEWNKNLIEFAPKVSVVDQYTGVVVKGRHRDRNQPKRVEERAGREEIAAELHTDAGDAPLLTGPEVREAFFPNRPNTQEAPNQPNLDAQRAAAQAAATIRKKARELVTVDVTTVGLPHLRPGAHFRVEKIGPPFDGYYYATKVVYTIGADGFRTKATGRRPGMPRPNRTGGTA